MLQRRQIEVNAADDSVGRIVAVRPEGQIACVDVGHGGEIRGMRIAVLSLRGGAGVASVCCLRGED